MDAQQLKTAVEDAREKYKTLCAENDLKKKILKQQGSKWQCFECRKLYPVEAFNASMQRSSDVFEKCLEPGHWRCCKICMEAHIELAVRMPEGRSPAKM